MNEWDEIMFEKLSPGDIPDECCDHIWHCKTGRILGEKGKL